MGDEAQAEKSRPGDPGLTQETTRPARRMRLPSPAPGNWKAGGLLRLQQDVISKKKKNLKKNPKFAQN